MLQFIDDTDDYEKDTLSHDWNAWNSSRAREYYYRMEACFYDNGKTLFPGVILRWFIKKMRKKAKKIMSDKQDFPL